MCAPEADKAADSGDIVRTELGPLSSRASILKADPLASLYLVKGLYKLAKGWQERGHLRSAKCIYRFILKVQDRCPEIACLEVPLSFNNLALILMLENAVMEAEDMFVRALASCYAILGDEHEIFSALLIDYAQLMRRMGLEEQALALERRAAASQEMSRHKNQTALPPLPA